MSDDQSQILSYARPLGKMPGRFRHLWAVLPFGVGLLIGGFLNGCLSIILPDFAPSPMADSGFAVMSLIAAPVLGSVYAFIVLLFTGFLSSHARRARPLWFTGMIGIMFQLFAGGLYELFNILCTVASPSQSLVSVGFFSGAVIVFFAGILLPFGLLRWRESQVTPRPTSHVRARWLTPLLVLSLCAVMFIAARWAAVRAFERDCREVAAWAKTTHPKAGSYTALPLPNSQRLLSGNGKVDAVLLADGRVVLVFRMSVSDSDNGHWSEIIYASGPIASAEIGKDPSGRSHILIDGLSEHVIEKQVDAQHFNALSPEVWEGW
jgi:hypothetical protein